MKKKYLVGDYEFVISRIEEEENYVMYFIEDGEKEYGIRYLDAPKYREFLKNRREYVKIELYDEDRDVKLLDTVCKVIDTDRIILLNHFGINAIKLHLNIMGEDIIYYIINRYDSPVKGTDMKVAIVESMELTAHIDKEDLVKAIKIQFEAALNTENGYMFIDEDIEKEFKKDNIIYIEFENGREIVLQEFNLDGEDILFALV